MMLPIDAFRLQIIVHIDPATAVMRVEDNGESVEIP